MKESIHKDTIRQAVILFADIMNSSELANNLSLDDYCNFVIIPFQEVAYQVVKKYLGKEMQQNAVRIEGEEVRIILYSDTLSPYEKLLKAMQIARELKIGFSLTPFNLDRIEAGKRPEDIGVGINIGEVKFIHNRNTDKVVPEGYAITIGKRVEDTSREKGAYTKIMLSRSAYQEALKHEMKISLTNVIKVSFKGISQLDSVYEIRHFYSFVYWELIEELNKDLSDGTDRFVQIFDIDYSNFWTGIELANCFLYHMNYNRAVDILDKLLLVHGDSSDVLVLLGECYEQLGVRAYTEGDKPRLRSYFERAEEAFKKSENMEPHREDMYVELGLLYYNWYRLLEPDEEKWWQAYELFTKGTNLGVTHTRSAFWKWRLDREKNKPDAEKSLLDLRWAVERPGRPGEIVIDEQAVEQYLQLFTLPNYRATVYQSVACVYGLQVKQFRKAKKYCDKAISEAGLVPEREGIYTTLGDFAGIIPKKTFIDQCNEIRGEFFEIDAIFEPVTSI
jgi:tetratricopeptide (TPR) repeat protein